MVNHYLRKLEKLLLQGGGSYLEMTVSDHQ